MLESWKILGKGKKNYGKSFSYVRMTWKMSAKNLKENVITEEKGF